MCGAAELVAGLWPLGGPPPQILVPGSLRAPTGCQATTQHLDAVDEAAQLASSVSDEVASL